MSEQPREKPVFDGKVRLEPHVLKHLLTGRGWTLKDFGSETGMQMRTVKRVFGAERINMATAREVAEEFDVPLLEIVDPAEYLPPQPNDVPGREIGRGEWTPSQALTPMLTAANGLQYRVYSMVHAFEPSRRGRGKRYEFPQLGDESRQELRHKLTRHMSVCSQLAKHPQFPVCYATFPDENRDTWWVIDEWIDGSTLADRIEKGNLSADVRYAIAKQLADGMAAAHERKIILREMTPHTILLAEDATRVVLTDFELAKLTDDYPTVSEEDWPDNQYRAPEIGAGEVNAIADVYSWGRIMVHATLGKLPDRGSEARELKFLTGEDGWVELLSRCLEMVPRKRPASMQQVRDAITEFE